MWFTMVEWTRQSQFLDFYTSHTSFYSHKQLNLRATSVFKDFVDIYSEESSTTSPAQAATDFTSRESTIGLLNTSLTSYETVVSFFTLSIFLSLLFVISLFC